MITYRRTRRSAKQIVAANHALQKSYKNRGLLLQNKNTNERLARAPAKVQIKRLEGSVSVLEAKVKEERQKKYGALRRAKWLHKAHEACKRNLKQAKNEAYHTQRELRALGQENVQVQADATGVVEHLASRIKQLEQTRRDSSQEHTTLVKRCTYLTHSNRTLKERLKGCSSTFRMKSKHQYSDQARKLARLLVSTGTAEAKVGKALVDIGGMLGIEVRGCMSKRTVQRTVLEKGVAADMQIVYEILKSGKITYSSDSTSHKHIEYECRTMALRVLDYSDPDAKPEWKLRTLGIGTSINHFSKVQVDGPKQRLNELADIFNDSPLAKRETLRFVPDDFAYHLIGTSGDHAADQKKSHDILRIWRLEVILQRLGEEALFHMEAGRVLASLISLKSKQIQEHSGQEAWDALDEEQKAAADAVLVRELGQQVFDTLPLEEQNKLTRFTRTGCCMHKDLNCVKGGVKAMGEMWSKLKRTGPVLLANKDNTAVLANRLNPSASTTVEKRAEEVSKRGGCHAAMLGGLICRNKDKKKGQHDTYNHYMEVHVGHHVPYPDVSNTRYGSHGEAAATIIVYHAHFIDFMDFVRNRKDKAVDTNIEKNFGKALKDPPMLTELCVLALYNVAVSRPFMCHVWSTDNILKLEGFFEQKARFLDSVIDDPSIWTADDIHYETGSLDRKEWDEWYVQVLGAIRKHAPQLPDLAFAIVAFIEDARDTFVERFSDEFKTGNGIDKLTDGERDELFFSSTNDANEGGLGSWRRGQCRRPAETLHKFNSSFISAQNDTEGFMSSKLTAEEDQLYGLYLIRSARKRDASGLQKQPKVAQMEADQVKVSENREKEAKQRGQRDQKAAVIAETAKNLVLDDAGIDKLNNSDLNKQLDYHRELERKLPAVANVETAEKIPLKSHMKIKADRVAELKKAVARYNSRHVVQGEGVVTETDSETEDKMMEDCGDAQYGSDYNDDLV